MIVNITTTAQKILPTDLKRHTLILQNNSDTPIYLAFGDNKSTLTASGNTRGIIIPSSGGTLIFDETDANFSAVSAAVWAIHGGTGTKELTYDVVSSAAS
jgi:hypothetical protein